MEGLELIAFKIISAVGSARSCYIEAIQEAKNSHFEHAEELIKEGETLFIEGHHAHSELIQEEAGGHKTEVNLILLHAEDQLMSAKSFKIIAEELIEIHKQMYDLRSNS